MPLLFSKSNCCIYCLVSHKKKFSPMKKVSTVLINWLKIQSKCFYDIFRCEADSRKTSDDDLPAKNQGVGKSVVCECVCALLRPA